MFNFGYIVVRAEYTELSPAGRGGPRRDRGRFGDDDRRRDAHQRDKATARAMAACAGGLQHIDTDRRSAHRRRGVWRSSTRGLQLLHASKVLFLALSVTFVFMATLRSRCRHYIFVLWFLLSFFFLA